MFSFALIISSTVFANDFNEAVKNLKCKTNAFKVLDKLSTNYEWRKIIKTNAFEVYRSPLGKIGNWVELIIGEKTELRKIANGKILLFSWNGSECIETKNDLGVVTAFENVPYKNSFTDSHLNKLLSKRKKYFLYVWSPGMVYSGKRHNQFKRVAERMGYTFVSLADENFSKDIIRGNAKANNITDQFQGFHSFDLLMREAGLHYPVSFIIESGKITRFPIVGVYSPEHLAHRIMLERRSLASEF